MRKIILTISLMLFSFSVFAQSEITKEEYSVYARILREIYKEELKNRKENADKNRKSEFVVLNQTKTFEKQSEQANSEVRKIEFPAEIQKAADEFVAGLKKSKTEEDFDLKNIKYSNVQKAFPITFKYSLVSKEEIDSLIAIGMKEFEETQKKRKARLPTYGGEGWDYFYKRFPNTNGYYQFSRVGFNSNKTFAKVYVKGNGSTWNSDVTYILRKNRGKWEIYALFGSNGVS